MIIAYAGMVLLAIYLGHMLYEAYDFFNILSLNLDMSDDLDVANRLKGGLFDRTCEQAEEEYFRMKCIHMPCMIASLLLTIGIVGAFLFGYTSPMFLLVCTTLFVTSVIVYYIGYEYFPNWLLDWNQLLAATHFQIHLEHVQSELKSCQGSLQQYKEGTVTISDEDLTALKLYTVELANEALRVTQLIKDTIIDATDEEEPLE